MSVKKNEKFKFNAYIIPGILLSIIILAILSSFGINMIQEAKDKVKEDYQVETSKICQIYERDIYAIEKAADLIAAELVIKDDLFEEDNINALAVAKKELNAENILIVDSSYAAVDANGNNIANVMDEQIFQSLFEAQTAVKKFQKNLNGENCIYIVRPISTSTETKGFIIVEYIPDVMTNLLEDPKFSSRKTFALVSSDGDIIELTGKKSYGCEPGKNIVELADSFIFVDGSYNLFRQAMTDCRSGYQQTIYMEEGKYIYYSPISGCKASVVMFVDTGDVEKSFTAVSKNVRNILIEIGIAVLGFIAIFAGIALYNKAKYNIETEDLQNKADTDLLTDLYNKVATERMIKEYLEGEGKDSISMLFVLDVDDFKKINDTRGHAFGDQVLSSLGHQIKAWFRVNDILGRIGGDEFMIFIKDVKDPEVVRREGSRIKQFFEGFNVGEYSKYSPTASVGGAVYPSDAQDFESLYKAADKAVYKSKKDGKNRVSFYADLNNTEKDVIIDKKEN